MASAASPVLSSTWKRIDGIDLLRGLAIFFVLMNHVNMRLQLAKVPYTRGLHPQLIKSLFWNGQFGVQMFFAVSGFLIASITLRRWGTLSQISISGFYRLRFARIAPLLLMLLSPCCTSADFMTSLCPQTQVDLGVPWSRHFVCRWLGQGKLLVTVLLGFVVLGPFARTALAHGNPTWSEYSYLGGMDAIAMGCLTALILTRVRCPRSVLWVLGGAGGALVLFILGFSLPAYRLGIGRYGLDMTVLAIGTCMLIAFFSCTRWKSPGALAPILRIGQYSYEIYLTHMFVVFVLFGLFLKAGKHMSLAPVLFVATVIVSGMLGAVVANFYSEPMNRLLRRRFLPVSTISGESVHAQSATATE